MIDRDVAIEPATGEFPPVSTPPPKRRRRYLPSNLRTPMVIVTIAEVRVV